MKLRFARKKNEANDIWSFWFTPSEPITWIAGQSLRLEIPAGYDTDERRFTIASAPYEKDIMITTRLSGSVFKKGLEKLEPGTIVNAYAIEGNFTWGESEKLRLFVAIGIGITPFRSILLQRFYEEKPINAHLIYAARAEDTIFATDFDAVRKNSKLTNNLLTQRINADYLLTKKPNLDNHLVFISGKAKTIEQISRDLLDYGIQRESIILDKFTL